MKRMRASLLVLALMLVAIPGIVMAANSTYKYKDLSLFATFSSKDGNNKTVTTVIASKKETDPKSANKMVLVASSTYDTKKKKLRWNMWGVTNSVQTLTINNNLKSGKVKANVKAYDSVKDDDYTLKVNLNWKQDGNKKNVNRNYTVKPVSNDTDAISLKGDVKGDERSADVNGSVKKGGKDWAGNVKDAYIQDLDSGSVTVTHPSK